MSCVLTFTRAIPRLFHRRRDSVSDSERLILASELDSPSVSLFPESSVESSSFETFPSWDAEVSWPLYRETIFNAEDDKAMALDVAHTELTVLQMKLDHARADYAVDRAFVRALLRTFTDEEHRWVNAFQMCASFQGFYRTAELWRDLDCSLPNFWRWLNMQSDVLDTRDTCKLFSARIEEAKVSVELLEESWFEDNEFPINWTLMGW